MRKKEHTKHILGTRFLAVWGIAILLGGFVGFLMFDNFQSRLKLQKESELEFLRHTEKMASSLAYFFGERRYDLNTLACGRAITTYFENQAMGMSMEYGLKASLVSAQEEFLRIIEQKKIETVLIYHRFMLVSRDGKVLVDCSPTDPKTVNSSGNLYATYNGKPEVSISLLAGDLYSGVAMRVPCYFKNEFVGALLAIVNSDSIAHQMGYRDSSNEMDFLILDKQTQAPLNKNPEVIAYLSALEKKTNPFSPGSFYFEDENRKPLLCVNAPISDTPFCVLSSVEHDNFKAGNPWAVLCAMVSLAVVVFGGGILVYRSAAGNLILRVRLEEKNSQQKILEQINRQLKQEVFQRQRNEILLGEKETTLRAIIESTTEGILVVNQNGQVMNWNRSFLKIWKLPDLVCIITLSEMKEFFLEQAQNADSFINEFCSLRQSTPWLSGTVVLKDESVIEYYACPIEVSDVLQGRVWAFRDISIHNRAEKTLQLAKEAAEASNRAKSEFLANMSHELRTPLNSIVGFSEILNEEELNERQKTYIETIHKSGLNLTEILNDLLLYSEIEAGCVNRDIQGSRLSDIVVSVKEYIAEQVRDKGLQLDVICEGQLPVVVYSDPQKIEKILKPILNNACKFTDHGHIRLIISSFLQGRQRWIRFVIADTGIGIPADKLQGIFDAFTQVDGSLTRKYGGVGTGLTIAQKLARLLGGEIQVQSEQGKGTTFTVILPVDHNTDTQSEPDWQAPIQYTTAKN